MIFHEKRVVKGEKSDLYQIKSGKLKNIDNSKLYSQHN